MTKSELLANLPDEYTISVTLHKRMLKTGSVGYSMSEKREIQGKDGSWIGLQCGVNVTASGSKKLE